MRDLIAALEEMRTALLRIIAALEEGDVIGALRLIQDAHATWTNAVEQLRASTKSNEPDVSRQEDASGPQPNGG